MDLRERKLLEIRQQRLRYMRAAAPPPGSLSVTKRNSLSSVAQKEACYPRKVIKDASSPFKQQPKEVLNMTKVEQSPLQENYAIAYSTHAQQSTPSTIQSPQSSKSMKSLQLQSPANADEEEKLPPLVFELSKRGLLPLASKRKSSMNLRREVEAKLFLGASA